jgi:hypothetical protein
MKEVMGLGPRSLIPWRSWISWVFRCRGCQKRRNSEAWVALKRVPLKQEEGLGIPHYVRNDGGAERGGSLEGNTPTRNTGAWGTHTHGAPTSAQTRRKAEGFLTAFGMTERAKRGGSLGGTTPHATIETMEKTREKSPTRNTGAWGTHQTRNVENTRQKSPHARHRRVGHPRWFYALAGLRRMKCITSKITPRIRAIWIKPLVTWNARNPANQRTIRTTAIIASMGLSPCPEINDIEDGGLCRCEHFRIYLHSSFQASNYLGPGVYLNRAQQGGTEHGRHEHKGKAE